MCNSPLENENSFISRAKKYIADSSVQIKWKDGRYNFCKLNDDNSSEIFDFPEVKYLSQQFVDQLCSSEGLSDDLIEEINKIIFNSHPIENKLGAKNFNEFLDLKTSQNSINRENYVASMKSQIFDLIEQHELLQSKKNTELKFNKLSEEIERDKKNYAEASKFSSESDENQLKMVNNRIDSIKNYIAENNRQIQSLQDLQSEINNFRNTWAPNYVKNLKTKYTNAKIDDSVWNEVEINISSNLDDTIQKQLDKLKNEINMINGSEDLNEEEIEQLEIGL